MTDNESTVDGSEATSDGPSIEESDRLSFEDVPDDRLEEIAQNIRISSDDGEIPLNALMLDLAVGHNELEQYKKGALSTVDAVDERLKEEQERNPDSLECQILKEVKHSAFGMYLRLQRGDKELHGERDGEYSGYFD